MNTKVNTEKIHIINQKVDKKKGERGRDTQNQKGGGCSILFNMQLLCMVNYNKILKEDRRKKIRTLVLNGKSIIEPRDFNMHYGFNPSKIK